MGSQKRIEVVQEALAAALGEMVDLSMKGENLQPRYRIGLVAYSDTARDLLHGVRAIDYVMEFIQQKGMFKFKIQEGTNPAAGFALVEELLASELPKIQDHPCPLIFHLTDGIYDPQYQDPEPIVDRIRLNASVLDGNVLVSNVFISDRINDLLPKDLKEWSGITKDMVIKDNYARKLRDMSSPYPATYRTNIAQRAHTELARNAVMFIPGINSELVKWAFQVSTMS